MTTVSCLKNEIQCKPIICSIDMFYNLRIVLHGPNKIPFYKLFHNEGKSRCLAMK